LRQAFYERRLADAGLANQYRIVLGAATENLHDALDLCFRPITDRDDRWTRLQLSHEKNSNKCGMSLRMPRIGAALPAISSRTGVQAKPRVKQDLRGHRPLFAQQTRATDAQYHMDDAASDPILVRVNAARAWFPEPAAIRLR
jgi:hypothetical protein